jgi:signal transduction histidine kinase
MDDNHRAKAPVLRTALVSAMALVWLLLLALQFQWSAASRDSTEARLRSNLQLALGNWQRDWYEELSVRGSLDSNALQKELFATLTERYFPSHDGLDYRVAIIVVGKTPRIVYSSDPALKIEDVESFDAKLSLFDAGENRSPERQWRLFAAYPSGFVTAMAKAVWYRHLILGTLPLFLLAALSALLMILSRRERKLAGLQMEFVASVSHELRTPLSAIFSAGENIRDGYIEGQKDLKFYGGILTSQSRRLIDLVDRILLFASTSAGKKRYSIVRVSVSEILAALRRNIRDELADERCTFEERMDPSLPDVCGDLTGVCVCLQNLIGNAAKYGGKDRWIGLSVSCKQSSSGSEVAFSVEDHGRGIRASELQTIFDPFYRSPDVRAAKIQGAGLGLALSRKVAQAMGGRISVVSEVGVGSTFTLYLRAVQPHPLIDQPISAKTDTVSHE